MQQHQLITYLQNTLKTFFILIFENQFLDLIYIGLTVRNDNLMIIIIIRNHQVLSIYIILLNFLFYGLHLILCIMFIGLQRSLFPYGTVKDDKSSKYQENSLVHQKYNKPESPMFEFKTFCSMTSLHGFSHFVENNFNKVGK